MFCFFLFVYLFAFFLFVFICLLFVFCFALLLNMKARITVLGKPLDVCKFCFLILSFTQIYANQVGVTSTGTATSQVPHACHGLLLSLTALRWVQSW